MLQALDSLVAARWKSAFLSTFLISSFPNIFLCLVPVSWVASGSNSFGLNVQHLMLAFASGGLLGDVLLHAIPHLLAPHGGSQDAEGGKDAVQDFMDRAEDLVADGKSCSAHDHWSLFVGCLVLLGFLFFFTTERILSIYLRSSGDEEEEAVIGEDSEESALDTLSKHTVKELKDMCRLKGVPVSGNKSALIERLEHAVVGNGAQSKEKDEEDCESEENVPSELSANLAAMSASGWLNLWADFMHNFTDGLAVGASHAIGDGKLALAATLSVFFHEVPHEIGDFAILLDNGVSKSSAIKMQFVTSIGAFLGTAIGMMVHTFNGWDEALIAFTSGGFLYVATVSLIPSILNKGESGQKSKASGRNDILQSVLEAVTFAAGVSMMVVVSLLEHH